MKVRQIRAILAKLPDDADVKVKINKTYVGVSKITYAGGSLNWTAIEIEDIDLHVAVEGLAERLIDEL